MANATRIIRFRFWLWLIRIVGVIVPRRLRSDWRQEWEAELRHREALLAEWDKLNWKNKLDLLRRSTSAFWDALWLQPKRLEDEMFQDLRFGLRMLLKHPGFTLIAVVTLALGIGAVTAIFGVVDAMLLKPLPYTDPQRLVWIGETSPYYATDPVPGAHFLEWSEQSRSLEQIAAYQVYYKNLTGAGEPERLECGVASAGFFPTLGVQPLLGRHFLPAEDRPGGERVAIISHGLWQRRFNSDPNVAGRPITLDDQSHRVIGVLPAGFRFFRPLELWVPLALDPQQERGNQMIRMLDVIARLKPGVTRAQARAELETITRRYGESRPKKGTPNLDAPVRVVALRERLVGDQRRLLLTLLGAVGLTLLIACANVANLTLARAAGRQKEMAVRAALGASRLRLLRQTLTESWLLACGGGAAGLLFAFWLTKLLVSLGSADAFGGISRLAEIRIDFRVLAFTALVSLITGTIFGFAPALHLSRPDLNSSFKEGGPRSGFGRSRLRNLLMIAEVALAIVLLAGAGLLIRSFVNLLNVNPGFRGENLLTARVNLPYPRYEDRVRREQFLRQTLEGVKALPGVESAAATCHLPLTEFVFSGWLRVEGRPGATSRPETGIPISQVTPDYFRTTGISLRAGRLFTESDNAGAPRVVIFNETLARKLFAGEDPIGKRVWVPGPGKDTPTVVGVVGDVRHQGPDKEVRPEVYVPYAQNPSGIITLVVRTTVDPLGLAGAVRERVLAVDRDQPVYEVMTMEQRLSNSVSARRFNLLLMGAFALLAMSLAAVGVYGVVAYVVTQREHEIGIRMALGARANDVLRMIVGQGMKLIVIGVALGLAGAFALTRVMKSLLFGVSATDPLTFAGVALLLTLIALLACFIPARRAAKVDPIVALRRE